MITHSQLTDHTTSRGVGYGADHKKKRGGYAFSADGLVRWDLSSWELFPSEIRWDDGTTQQLLKQQRPSLIFHPTTHQLPRLACATPSCACVCHAACLARWFATDVGQKHACPFCQQPWGEQPVPPSSTC